MSLFSRCLLLSIFLFLCGCSTSYRVANGSSKRVHPFSWLNDELSGEVVDIYTVDSTFENARDVYIDHDSVAWYNLQSPVRHSLPSFDVKRICRTNHTLGFVEGFLGGVAGGVGALYEGLNLNHFSFSEGETYQESPLGDILLITGLLLPPTGIIVGASCGHRYEYIILSDSASSQSYKPRGSN